MDEEITAPQQQSFVTLAYRRVCAHFAAYRKLSWWPFLWRITLEGLAVSIMVAIFLRVLFPSLESTQSPRTILKAFFSLIFLAPIIETFLLQSFPVMVVRICKGGFKLQLLAAWLPFAGLHFTNNVGSGIAAGIFGGFYFAFTYVHWRQRSLSEAYWMTVATHALHNLTPFIALYIDEVLGG